MNKVFPKEMMRKALTDVLPETDVTSSSEILNKPQLTYMPASHARALSPENIIVEGIRGAGKSHWWGILTSKENREYLASVFPEAKFMVDNLIVTQGFGAGYSLEEPGWPSKDVLPKLVKTYDSRNIWKALLGVHLAFPNPFPTQGDWNTRIAWVQENPEIYDQLLLNADRNFAERHEVRLIMFDALDRLADTWSDIRPLARSLFQLALDLRSLRAIRMKLFVRSDMLRDKTILAFPDSSKLRSIPLTWMRNDLYALLFQRLCNSELYGRDFRESCTTLFGIRWQTSANGNAWALPFELKHDDTTQREVFHAITGSAMGTSTKRGIPYVWLPNHLLDGLDQVSPRSFIEAIKQAAFSSNQAPPDWPYALHYKAIHHGVQQASKIRVEELIKEDYPWVDFMMEPLRGSISVPCPEDDILEKWRIHGSVEHLGEKILNSKVKLPPTRIGEGEKGVLLDLMDLGIFQKIWDGRVQSPDVYRIAFGFGRRGGVKPLR